MYEQVRTVRCTLLGTLVGKYLLSPKCAREPTKLFNRSFIFKFCDVLVPPPPLLARRPSIELEYDSEYDVLRRREKINWISILKLFTLFDSERS